MKRSKNYTKEKVDSLIGNKYSKLTIIDVIEYNGIKSKVLCECDCGNKKVINLMNIIYERTKSCGCFGNKLAENRIKKNAAERLKGFVKKNYVDGARLDSYRYPESKVNKTGRKGVQLMQNGKYRARIVFKRKDVHLGVFDYFEDAVKAREDAETFYRKKLEEIKRSTQK